MTSRFHPTGAPLPPPVTAYAVLTVAAAVVPTALAGVAPWTSDRAMNAFYLGHPDAARWQALLTLAAAVPLAVLAAVLSDRIRALGLEVPGRLIALVGGAVAAALLAVSGAVTLALASGDPGVLRTGQALATALGGTAFAPFVGLLVAGVAVTGLAGRLLPRPVAWAGLAVAAVAEVAVLTAVVDGLSFLLPVARFGSAVFLLVVAFTLRPAATVGP